MKSFLRGRMTLSSRGAAISEIVVQKSDVLQIEIETDNLSNESFEVDESRSDSEKCVDELALADYVAFG